MLDPSLIVQATSLIYDHRTLSNERNEAEAFILQHQTLESIPSFLNVLRCAAADIHNCNGQHHMASTYSPQALFMSCSVIRKAIFNGWNCFTLLEKDALYCNKGCGDRKLESSQYSPQYNSQGTSAIEDLILFLINGMLFGWCIFGSNSSQYPFVMKEVQTTIVFLLKNGLVEHETVCLNIILDHLCARTKHLWEQVCQLKEGCCLGGGVAAGGEQEIQLCVALSTLQLLVTEFSYLNVRRSIAQHRRCATSFKREAIDVIFFITSRIVLQCVKSCVLPLSVCQASSGDLCSNGGVPFPSDFAAASALFSEMDRVRRKTLRRTKQAASTVSAGGGMDLTERPLSDQLHTGESSDEDEGNMTLDWDAFRSPTSTVGENNNKLRSSTSQQFGDESNSTTPINNRRGNASIFGNNDNNNCFFGSDEPFNTPNFSISPTTPDNPSLQLQQQQSVSSLLCLPQHQYMVNAIDWAARCSYINTVIASPMIITETLKLFESVLGFDFMCAPPQSRQSMPAGVSGSILIHGLGSDGVCGTGSGKFDISPTSSNTCSDGGDTGAEQWTLHFPGTWKTTILDSNLLGSLLCLYQGRAVEPNTFLYLMERSKNIALSQGIPETGLTFQENFSTYGTNNAKEVSATSYGMARSENVENNADMVASYRAPGIYNTALNCMRFLTSARRSLFADERERSLWLRQILAMCVYLIRHPTHFVVGGSGTSGWYANMSQSSLFIKEILEDSSTSESSLSSLGHTDNDPEALAEFCLLLNRIKPNFQLDELMKQGLLYEIWIHSVAAFTVDIFLHWRGRWGEELLAPVMTCIGYNSSQGRDSGGVRGNLTSAQALSVRDRNQSSRRVLEDLRDYEQQDQYSKFSQSFTPFIVDPEGQWSSGDTTGMGSFYVNPITAVLTSNRSHTPQGQETLQQQETKIDSSKLAAIHSQYNLFSSERTDIGILSLASMWSRLAASVSYNSGQSGYSSYNKKSGRSQTNSYPISNCVKTSCPPQQETFAANPESPCFNHRIDDLLPEIIYAFIFSRMEVASDTASHLEAKGCATGSDTVMEARWKQLVEDVGETAPNPPECDENYTEMVNHFMASLVRHSFHVVGGIVARIFSGIASQYVGAVIALWGQPGTSHNDNINNTMQVSSSDLLISEFQLAHLLYLLGSILRVRHVSSLPLQFLATRRGTTGQNSDDRNKAISIRDGCRLEMDIQDIEDNYTQNSTSNITSPTDNRRAPPQTNFISLTDLSAETDANIITAVFELLEYESYHVKKLLSPHAAKATIGGSGGGPCMYYCGLGSSVHSIESAFLFFIRNFREVYLTTTSMSRSGIGAYHDRAAGKSYGEGSTSRMVSVPKTLEHLQDKLIRQWKKNDVMGRIFGRSKTRESNGEVPTQQGIRNPSSCGPSVNEIEELLLGAAEVQKVQFSVMLVLMEKIKDNIEFWSSYDSSRLTTVSINGRSGVESVSDSIVDSGIFPFGDVFHRFGGCESGDENDYHISGVRAVTRGNSSNTVANAKLRNVECRHIVFETLQVFLNLASTLTTGSSSFTAMGISAASSACPDGTGVHKTIPSQPLKVAQLIPAIRFFISPDSSQNLCFLQDFKFQRLRLEFRTTVSTIFFLEHGSSLEYRRYISPMTAMLVDLYNALKDNGGRWPQGSETSIGAFIGLCTQDGMINPVSFEGRSPSARDLSNHPSEGYKSISTTTVRHLVAGVLSDLRGIFRAALSRRVYQLACFDFMFSVVNWHNGHPFFVSDLIIWLIGYCTATLVNRSGSAPVVPDPRDPSTYPPLSTHQPLESSTTTGMSREKGVGDAFGNKCVLSNDVVVEVQTLRLIEEVLNSRCQRIAFDNHSIHGALLFRFGAKILDTCLTAKIWKIIKILRLLRDGTFADEFDTPTTVSSVKQFISITAGRDLNSAKQHIKKNLTKDDDRLIALATFGNPYYKITDEIFYYNWFYKSGHLMIMISTNLLSAMYLNLTSSSISNDLQKVLECAWQLLRMYSFKELLIYSKLLKSFFQLTEALVTMHPPTPPTWAGTSVVLVSGGDMATNYSLSHVQQQHPLICAIQSPSSNFLTFVARMPSEDVVQLLFAIECCIETGGATGSSSSYTKNYQQPAMVSAVNALTELVRTLAECFTWLLCSSSVTAEPSSSSPLPYTSKPSDSAIAVYRAFEQHLQAASGAIGANCVNRSQTMGIHVNYLTRLLLIILQKCIEDDGGNNLWTLSQPILPIIVLNPSALAFVEEHFLAVVATRQASLSMNKGDTPCPIAAGSDVTTPPPSRDTSPTHINRSFRGKVSGAFVMLLHKLCPTRLCPIEALPVEHQASMRRLRNGIQQLPNSQSSVETRVYSNSFSGNSEECGEDTVDENRGTRSQEETIQFDYLPASIVLQQSTSQREHWIGRLGITDKGTKDNFNHNLNLFCHTMKELL